MDFKKIATMINLDLWQWNTFGIPSDLLLKIRDLWSEINSKMNWSKLEKEVLEFETGLYKELEMAKQKKAKNSLLFFFIKITHLLDFLLYNKFVIKKPFQ